MSRVLVLGGARSGKSRYAEGLVAALPRVDYVAPGPVPTADDPEWAARVAAHVARRPAHWRTVETGDVPGALAHAADGTSVLVDCLGTWTTRMIDDAQGWDSPDAARAAVAAGVDALTGALRALDDAAGHVVLVSNETGLGVVPGTSAGRLFRDCLGRVNAAAADACDRVALVVAGRVIDLSDSPRVDDTTPLPAPAGGIPTREGTSRHA